MNLNPTGSIPTITEGRFCVLGGYPVFLQFLANYHKQVKDKFRPNSKKDEIEKSIQWY